MKKATTMALFVMLFSNVKTFAQMPMQDMGKAKIIAVVNKASWCPVCKVHGQNAGMVMMPYTQQGLAILMNDLTDDQSKAAAKKELTSAGVYYAVKGVKETGVVIFVDAKTHKKLGQTSIAIDNEDLKKKIEKYLKS
jgi:L-lactate utilization protein LutC